MKRITALFFVLLMLLSFPAAASAVNVSDFYDVSSSDWFYNAVSFVTQNGMFSGTAANSFSPQSTMTRGMFVTVLGRYGGVSASSDSANMGVVTHSDVNMRSAPGTDGSRILACLQKNAYVQVLDLVDDSSASGYRWYKVTYNGLTGYIRSDLMEAALNNFTDVPAGAYYEPYVIWACSSFIASATGETTFSPDRPITRQEICSMLYNFAALKNVQLKQTVSLKSFSDVSGSDTNISALQAAGVINGYDDGSFKPNGSATRAEVSVMLMRFIDAISYHPVYEPSTDSSGNYIFGTEVPSSASVSASYFSDACFIGHSLVVGMKSYSGITNADYLAFNGAYAAPNLPNSILSYEDFPLSGTHVDENGSTVQNKGTLSQALGEKSYGKVYIMLGVNEVGPASYHQQAFYSNMGQLIYTVRASQPTATIYLISTTPVSQKCSESREDVNRDNLIAFNDVIKQLCRERRAYYLNVFDLLVDADGFLPETSCMSDGLHLLSPQYRQISDYLCSHTA